MPEVRTRFAPSPTGYLHIGGARTALFNYLYACHCDGKFVLRIEDTDRQRSTPEAIDAILESMEWLKLEWDEGPFYQTERMDLYKDRIRTLLDAGDAYPCVCTPETLNAKREAALAEKRKPMYDGTCRPAERAPVPLPEGVPYTIRFRSPESGATVVDDKVKGPVEFDNTELDDLILARSDGSPTYNFCVVCDDIDMGITHIIRGDDHLSNTPRQMQLYQALGSEPPVFAHVPLILGEDKKRLSKRHGATSVTAYRDMGYYPEALNNYLVRLGWSHGDQEIFDGGELVEKFDIDAVGASSAVFNPEKLLWLNAHYLKNRPASQLAEDVAPYLAAKGYTVPGDRAWLEKMVETLRERAKSLVEVADMAHYFLTETVEIDEKAGGKHLVPEAKSLLQEVSVKLGNLADFNQAGIEQVFGDIVADRDIKLGRVAQPVRVALTGSTVSPGIYEVIDVLGRDVTLARLAAGVRYIDARLSTEN
ncbi:MAG: glutamate--tRNA ligase [Deltaproteobacteria bacterium]|nr:glutamate--tRNA ligase [Deltaproteobacteria bacterium]